MKKTILFFAAIGFMFLFNKTSIAQAPNWLWAKSAGSSYDDQANAVAADASGNVYATGWFDYDTLKFGSSALINAGANDIFLVKYDLNGNVLWAKSAGGTSYDYANSVALDNSGNIYITGFFQSDTMWFGSSMLLNTGGSDDTKDLFIAKYDASGNFKWARNAEGLGDDESNGIAVDASGNAYITGSFTSFFITFNTTMLTNTDTTSYTNDIFIAKYNSGGSLVWAKSAGDIGWDEALSVAVDASGNAYIAGNYDSPTLTFGSNTLINMDNSGNTDDVFLAKYNSSGNIQWAKSAGSINYDYANSIATDATGNIYMTGWFKGTNINFDTDTLINTDSTGNSNDIFLAKYNTNGNPLWGTSAGGDGDDGAASVAVNASGNAFITGIFQSPEIYFDSTTLTNNDTNYYNDIFIAKYDFSGNVLWAKSVGGSSDDDAYSIAVDASGNSYVAGGFFSPTILFGTTTLTDFDNTTNTEDLFVAKLAAIAGINEFKNSLTISLFPNPASNNLTLEIPQKSLIEIFNIEGQLIESSKTDKSLTIIDISGLSKGMYFLKASNYQGNAVVKFVKE